MKDALGDRMKANYENRSRISLARRSYTIIRIDGKAFHTYTKGLKRPFDDELMEDMDSTAMYLCKNIQGAKFAFVQSDEISILLTDFDDQDTQAWFDNNLQKMCSVSASMATRAFNEARMNRYIDECIKMEHNIQDVRHPTTKILAEFDSRVFQIPQRTEVENYFIWRQQDTVRNSIQSVSQSLYSQKQLHGKTTDEQQEMIFQKGINWNDYDAKYKRGRLIVKEMYEKEVESEVLASGSVTRSRWISVGPPIFTQERETLRLLIPDNI